MKKVMSIQNQIKYLKTLNGIAWICAGIFKVFDNIPCMALTIVSFGCSVFMLLKVELSEKENEDEMAIRDLNDAKSMTLTQLHVIICVASVFFLFFVKSSLAQQINWSRLIVPAIFITLGIEDLLTGIHFKRLEE